MKKINEEEMPLQQHEDDVAIEVAGDHIEMTPATQNFQDA